jgi:hypothetical protein
LTKEIRMTQDLMELFIKYQIPSDLLSYSGPEGASKEAKIKTVQTYIANMQKMIEDSKKKELTEAAQTAVYAQLVPSLPSKPTITTTSSSSMVMKDMMVEKRSAPVRRSASPKAFSSAIMPTSSVSASPPPAPSPSPSPAPAPPAAQAAPVPSSSTPTSGTAEPKIVSNQVDSTEEVGDAIDYTKIPGQLDKKYEQLDEDSALRPTIINLGTTWNKNYQKALLSEPASETLHKTQQTQEKNKAYDLLDALSRSGALTIDQASLHVVIAATHCFDKSLMNTVIQDNINPIEKVERSTLIVSTTIHDKPAIELVKQDQLDRVRTYSPLLFGPVVAALEAGK